MKIAQKQQQKQKQSGDIVLPIKQCVLGGSIEDSWNNSLTDVATSAQIDQTRHQVMNAIDLFRQNIDTVTKKKPKFASKE